MVEILTPKTKLMVRSAHSPRNNNPPIYLHEFHRHTHEFIVVNISSRLSSHHNQMNQRQRFKL